jgi:hypothetical protein
MGSAPPRRRRRDPGASAPLRRFAVPFVYGSGVTCWRRLRDGQKAGVWDAPHQRLLEKLNAAGAIDWSRAAVDGSHVRALLGGS